MILTWTTLLSSVVWQGRLSARIIFHRRLLFMIVGIAVYYAILYALSVFRPDEGFSTGKAL